MNTTEPTLHCQVCGRAIKAKNGIIAHHGYKRPGDGWQTASCYGARHVPYEVGHDALDLAIVSVTNHIARAEERHAELCFGINLPATLDKRVGTSSWDYKYVPVAKPDDFEPTPNEARPYGRTYSREAKYDYDRLFDEQLGRLRRDIEASRVTRDYLVTRRAAWVAPVEVPA